MTACKMLKGALSVTQLYAIHSDLTKITAAFTAFSLQHTAFAAYLLQHTAFVSSSAID